MFTKTALVSALMATVAIAAPAQVKRDTGSFSMMALRSGSDVHYASLNANSTAFYLKRDTSTSCALSSGCPAGNVTAVSISETGTLHMSDEVPGGQQVYISPSGILTYTEPHSPALPSDAITDGFSYTAGTSTSPGSLTHGTDNFYACPQGDSSYTIYVTAAGPNSYCLDIDIATAAFTGTAAWEYN